MNRNRAGTAATGTIFSAAVIAASFGVSSAPASVCGGWPDCHGGPPPGATRAATARECTDPKCVSGTQPARRGDVPPRVLAGAAPSPPPHPGV